MNAFRKTLTIVVFALLLFVPFFAVCFRTAGGVIEDPDVWWHLRAADWMVAQRAVPQFDTFAAPHPREEADADDEDAASKPAKDAAVKSTAASAEQPVPWVDYSWAAQLVLGGFHRILAEKGLVAYAALLEFSIILAFFVLVRRMQQSLLFAAALVLVATMGLQATATPRPWLFSILFFVIELEVLLEAGRSARPRLLLWLVPLFCLWANVHIQFVIGLVVLAAAVVEPLLARWAQRVRWLPLVLDGESTAVSPGWLSLILALCCGATLLNPYHVRLYATVFELQSQQKLWNYISELAAMPFRGLADWAVLAAALVGAAAVAARRPLRLLLVMLFPLAAYCSFRSRRDQWFVLFVGLALAASMSRGLPWRPTWLTRRARWAVAALLTAMAWGSLWILDEVRLEARVAKAFPAQAVAFVRQGGYEGPLYNTYNWGGYLIYYLPEYPVSIDGRTVIYGTARVIHCLKIQHGDEGWQSDPALAAARLLILPRKEPLTLLLRLDTRFNAVYEDDVAVVFVRRQGR